MKDALTILENALTDANFRKLLAIPDRRVHKFVANAIELFKPMKVFVCNDTKMDTEYIRRTAIARNEETPLANPYHTVHFDGLHDQARDKERTVYHVPKDESLGEQLLQMDREKGLDIDPGVQHVADFADHVAALTALDHGTLQSVETPRTGTRLGACGRRVLLGRLALLVRRGRLKRTAGAARGQLEHPQILAGDENLYI